MKQNEVFASIALAMHEFQGNNVHDKEADVITIKEHHTDWSSRILTMTAHP